METTMNNEHSQKLGELEHSVYTLVGDLNELVVREQSNLQEELARVGSIIADAAEGLTHNFSVLNLKIEMQSRYMQDGYMDDDREEKLERVNREIDENLTETIRSLQFEDIVQQLTNHSRNRAVNMENLFIALKIHLEVLKATSVDESEKFNRLVNLMQDDIEKFRDGVWNSNPVRQKSMSEGHVELF